jgi:predicted metal-dependent peptidase
MTNHEVLEDIQKTAIQLIMKEQFYGHFFNNLNREVVSGNHPVQTAAISMDPSNNLLKLIVNNEFWTKKIKGDFSNDSTEYRDAKYWVIKHEILHILFKHIFKWAKYGNKTLANIAVDFVVHQCIKLEKIPVNMRESLALLENYPDFFPNITDDWTGSDNHQTTDYYYSKLLKEDEKIRQILKDGQPCTKGAGNSSQGEGESGDADSNENGEGKGDGPSKLEDNTNWDKLNGSQKNLAKFIGQEDNRTMHSTWKEMSKLDNGQKEFTNSWIDSTVSEVVKKLDKSKNKSNSNWRGTMPAGLLQYIEELIASLKPSVNWKRKLRQFAQNGAKSYLKGTISKRSKRFNTFPGTKIRSECKVLVAIDTSGSVDNESLAEFFSEIRWIYKSKAEILIVECDTVIGKKWKYKGKFPGEITGRGGTDFNAPIIYANTEYRPDCLIYFTDGEAPPPVKCKCPIMWLITKNQGRSAEDMADFQGIKIKMDF